MLAKRMGLSISEMARVDVATLLDMSDAWFGGGGADAGRAADTVRAGTTRDASRIF